MPGGGCHLAFDCAIIGQLVRDHDAQWAPERPQYIEKRRRRRIGRPFGAFPTISCVTPGGSEPSGLAGAACPLATSIWTKRAVASSTGAMTSPAGDGAPVEPGSPLGIAGLVGSGVCA